MLYLNVTLLRSTKNSDILTHQELVKNINFFLSAMSHLVFKYLGFDRTIQNPQISKGTGILDNDRKSSLKGSMYLLNKPAKQLIDF